MRAEPGAGESSPPRAYGARLCQGHWGDGYLLASAFLQLPVVLGLLVAE